MTCRSLIAFLDRYLAGELAPDVRRAFDAHLDGCPACRAYLRTYRDTVDMAQRDGDAVDAGAPPDLVKAILLAAREADYHR